MFFLNKGFTWVFFFLKNIFKEKKYIVLLIYL